jgi:hypothetical protein
MGRERGEGDTVVKALGAWAWKIKQGWGALTH